MVSDILLFCIVYHVLIMVVNSHRSFVPYPYTRTKKRIHRTTDRQTDRHRHTRRLTIWSGLSSCRGGGPALPPKNKWILFPVFGNFCALSEHDVSLSYCDECIALKKLAKRTTNDRVRSAANDALKFITKKEHLLNKILRKSSSRRGLCLCPCVGYG